MKILFLGSSHFSKIVLEKMLKNGVDVCGVVTQPDRPSGRGHKLTPTEIKLFAQANNIPVYTFEKIRLSMDEVKKIDYDVSVVASFGQILPQEFLDFRPCINVHPSLLPLYRGASPIQTAILNGDLVTGVTIMKVAMEVDAGDIILQRKVEINQESYYELEEKLASIGGDMATEVVCQYQNKSAKFTPQNHEKATFTSKFSKIDGVLDFSKSAKSIVDRVRALGEEYGCSFSVEGQTIKISKLKDVSDEFSVGQYQILNNKKRFVIGCQNGAVEILALTAPSGKIVAGRDYINGHNDILGKQVDKCLQI